jgi:hypothetical protein
MKTNFFEAVENRRSIYALGKTKTVSEERLREIVEFAVKHTPSPFNSQSGRVVILFGKHSNTFWNFTREALKKIVPADAFMATEERIASFEAGYGTILFFEDQAVVDGLQANFAAFKDKFPVWSIQSNGMLEFAIWTALESEGLGASLQHYDPLVDADVMKEWKTPGSWKLVAEMPFGSVTAPAGIKEFSPLDSRVKVFS